MIKFSFFLISLFVYFTATNLSAYQDPNLLKKIEYYKFQADEMIANDFASAEKYSDSIFNLTQKLEDPITALGYYFSIKAGVEKQRGLYINALKYYLECYSLTIQRYKTNIIGNWIGDENLR